MRTLWRSVLGLAAGLALAIGLLVAVEAFSAIVHPFPANFDGNIPAHVKRYPAWVLAVVVPMWAGTAAAAAWAAARIGRQPAGLAVSLVLAAGLIFNLAMLPYPMWFKVAMLLAFPPACLAGIRYGQR